MDVRGLFVDFGVLGFVMVVLMKEKGNIFFRVVRRDCYRVDKLDDWERRVK